MVAEYLDKNYDRVRLFSEGRFFVETKDRYTLVLLILYYPHPLQQLCHETSVLKAPRRDSIRPGKLQCHDTLHRKRSQP
jgi:hypothetical protein